MKLRDLMLMTARKAGIVSEGTATAGSTTGLTDTALKDPAETYAGGTLWLFGTTTAGVYDVTRHGSGGVIACAQTLAAAVQVGDAYALAGPKFERRLLKQACLTALTAPLMMLYNVSLTVVADQEEYDLPAGVSNLKRAEVAANDSAPYGYVISYFWKEGGGKLLFDRGNVPGDSGKKIRVWYPGKHSAITESGDITGDVPAEFLVWAALIELYRWEMNTTHKDNPVLVDLMNEAKIELMRYPIRLWPRDPHYSGW